MINHIETQATLKAPISRVWQALTDYQQFGEWFGVQITKPFISGQVIDGILSNPSYAHLPWQIEVKEINLEHSFSFTWHPHAVEPEIDYSKEIPTLVEFKLQASSDSETQLTLVEAGFDKLPAHRQAKALQMNSQGWKIQMTNLANYLSNPSL